MNRETLIKDLRSRSGMEWDIIVIGGGATGMGIALDGATRGYKTLLLEQSDFAKGTSSRSTKLLHGGVRYLAQGDLLLVVEALHERGLILKNAPHLTSNQEFVIPLYTILDVIKYTIGLKFYDLLAGRLSIGKSYFINRRNTLTRIPRLKDKGLKGGVVYHDGQFDDSRMVIALAQSCFANGGVALNYFKVNSLVKNEEGKVIGVKAQELISGEEFNLKAKLVINAAGVFADNVTLMDNPESKPAIRPSQGIHIVIENTFLQSNSAIMIPKTDDGRVLFAIPWYKKVILGTTDTLLDKISLEPKALEKEINFILQTAEKYLVKPPRREDILCVYAGLRPLAASSDNSASTKEISRRHKIIISKSGFLTIIGGKWTTYRRMAEETIDKAIKAGLLKSEKCITSDIMLSDTESGNSSSPFRIYGNNFHEIEEMIREKPELGKLIDPRLPYTKAEIIWICRNEMALMLEDMLARRTRALFLDARASYEIAGEVAGIMAAEMGYDVDWQEKQVELYGHLINNYIQDI